MKTAGDRVLSSISYNNQTVPESGEPRVRTARKQKNLATQKVARFSYFLVPRAGNENQAFMRASLNFREVIVKHLESSQAALLNSVGVFYRPVATQSEAIRWLQTTKAPRHQSRCQGAFLFGPCLADHSSIIRVAISLLCHPLIFRCARAE